jgi:hypothetical protein
MINFLFLMATATASDVYGICVHKEQIWSDDHQDWIPDVTTIHLPSEAMQLIIHKNSFEIDRNVKSITSVETIENLPCFREHKNSFICLDEPNKRFLWEFHKRNGEVTRDVFTYCIKNGEPA